MSKVYPFQKREKVFAGLLVMLLLAGFFPVRAAAPLDDRWQVCIYIGFIPSWYHCWSFGGTKPGPMQPEGPTYPCSDNDTGPCAL